MKLKVLACLSSLILFSLQTKAQNYIIFSGKIENALGKGLTLYSNKANLIQFNSDGSFRDTIYQAHGFLRLLDEKRNKLTIYMDLGDDLHLSYDMNNADDSYHFTGTAAPVNNYLLQKRKLKNRYDEEIKTKTGSAFFDLEANDFWSSEQEHKLDKLALLSSSTGLTDSFRKNEMRNIHYEYLVNIRMYEDYQQNIAGKKDFRNSAEVNAAINAIDYSREEDFLFSDAYRNLIEMYCLKKGNEIAAAEKITPDVARLKAMASLDNPYIRNSVMIKHARSFFNLSKDLKGYYETFMKGSTNSDHKQEMAELYASLTKVAPGFPAPKFVGYENYFGGTKSLDDFKGKYVYIDIWATWCGPCIYQLPFVDTLKRDYKGKNIEFVTLSIDYPRDHQKWRDFIRDNNLTGTQLLADNAFDSEFIKAFDISGIPRFLLIDPKGNIVSNNAPRPSDESLRKMLDELLQDDG